MKVAVRWATTSCRASRSARGCPSAMPPLHKVAVNVPDVSTNSRYIKVVDDARSELVIRSCCTTAASACSNLESPGLNAYEGARRHPDAAREQGRGRDRERAAVRKRSPRTSAGSRRRSTSRSGCRPGCCRSTREMKGVDVAARLEPARGSASVRSRHRRRRRWAKAWPRRCTAPFRRTAPHRSCTPSAWRGVLIKRRLRARG